MATLKKAASSSLQWDISAQPAGSESGCDRALQPVPGASHLQRHCMRPAAMHPQLCIAYMISDLESLLSLYAMIQ